MKNGRFAIDHRFVEARDARTYDGDPTGVRFESHEAKTFVEGRKQEDVRRCHEIGNVVPQAKEANKTSIEQVAGLAEDLSLEHPPAHEHQPSVRPCIQDRSEDA